MKFALILFSCTWFAVQTPMGQLLKLPLLVEHYLQHKKKESSSLAQFLLGHYKADHNDDDFPEDEQLPFKNMHYFQLNNALVQNYSSQQVTLIFCAIKNSPLPVTSIPKKYPSGIFHPPRLRD